MVVDVLGSAGGKENRVGSLNITVPIPRFSSVEVGSRVVVMDSVLVAVGAGTVGNRSSVGNHRTGDDGSMGNNGTGDSMGNHRTGDSMGSNRSNSSAKGSD